jgi:hypothetical protein
MEPAAHKRIPVWQGFFAFEFRVHSAVEQEAMAARF